MTKQVVLTEEEYNELLNKTVVDENHTIVSKSDLEYLEACECSLNSFADPVGLCPICRKAILIRGYVCPSCGYDSSYSVKEWNKMHKQ